MLVIYGLGNNDKKYYNTKHNAGRFVLENLVADLGLSFQKKLSFSYAKTAIQNQEVYFLYSNGFMNNSGIPLTSMCKYFKLDFASDVSNLVILQDDSDQQELKTKLVQAGGSAGHHGINSVYKQVLSLRIPMDRIWKLKIGIRPLENHSKSETFVLKNLNQKELTFLQNLATQLNSFLPQWVEGSFDSSQSVLNQSLTLG
ncbi:MAG: aminoacyl-tRNA hydrolase [Patescibacteria group bacterium]